jgi:hypothetical protein
VIQLKVRYGRNHQVIIALILPCLLIAPFILLQKHFAPDAGTTGFITVLLFSASMIGLSVWLSLRVYPQALFTVDGTQCRLTFSKEKILQPADRVFQWSEINTFTRQTIGGMPYYMVELRPPGGKFQISPAKNTWEDLRRFELTMKRLARQIAATHTATPSTYAGKQSTS